MNKTLAISALATTFAIFLSASPANAAARTWVGSTSTDWITAANWGGTAPASGDSLTFNAAGTQGATLTNTLTSTAFNVAGITFGSTAPAYTMNGNTFTLTAGITNNSTSLETFNNTGITGTPVTTPTSTAGLTTATALTFNTGGGITLSGLQFTMTGTSGLTTTANGTGTLTIGVVGIDLGSVSRVVQTFNGSAPIVITTVNAGGTGATASATNGSFGYAGSNSLTLNGVSNTTSFADFVSSGTFILNGSIGGGMSTSGTGVFTENSTGVLIGGGTFVQASTGASSLAGANTYTGTTTISGGTLNLTGSLGATAITNSATFTESGAGVIGSTATLTNSAGTTTLSGLNTYTGATTVNGGTLTLDFSAATTPTSATNIIKTGDTINLGDGALVVKGGGSGATNSQTFGTTALTTLTSSKITANSNGGTALNLALGAISRGVQSTVDVTLPTTGTLSSTSTTFASNSVLVSAASNGIAFATVGGTTWATNAAGTIGGLASYQTAYGTPASNIDVGAADAPTAAFTVNTLRFNSAGASLTATGTNTISTGGILVTSTGTGTSLTGGNIQSGGGKELDIIDNGSLNIGSVIQDNASASALTASGAGTTTLSAANTFSGTTAIIGAGNLQLGNANALQNSTLAFNANSATANLTFSSGIGTFTVAGLAGSTNGANILTLTDTGGTGVNLQVGNNNTNSVDFVSGINGAAGAVLTKIGTGTLTLNGGNNITVPVVVNAGSVYSQGTLPLQNVPSLTINNGGVVYYQRGSVGIANGAATDTVTINSGGILSSDYVSGGGSQDTGIGAVTLNGGTIATRNQPTTGTPIIYDRGTFQLGNYTGAVGGVPAVTAGGGTNPTSTISAVNVGLRGSSPGTIFNVMAGSGTGGSASATGGVDLLFSGTILSRSNNGNTALIKQGNGVMELTGANAFITPVQVNGGILQINSIANGGVQTTGTAASGATSVSVTSATGIAAGEAVGFLSGSNINAGTTVGSTYASGTSVPLAIPTNSTDTGTTAGAVNTTLTFGFANPLGISTNVATNLIIDGGTLQYVGGTGSTDRLFQIGSTVAGGTGTIDSSGTGALTFSNTGAIAYGTTAQTRTLVLTGTNTGANALAPLIANNGTGAVSVTKTGAGSWTLTGANTYSGGTTVSGGTLLTGSATALGSTSDSVAVNSGATLDLDGNSQTVGAVTLGTGGSNVSDSGAAATLTGSSVTVSGTGNLINAGATVSGGTTGVSFSGTGAKLGINGTLTAGSGGVTIGNGTSTAIVTLNSGGSIGSTTVSIGNGSTLALGSGIAANATNTVGGPVTLNTGGAVNLQNGSIGTLATGNLTVGTGSGTSFSFDIGAGSTGNLDAVSAGTLTVSGTGGVTINVQNVTGMPTTGTTLTLGTYNLVSDTNASPLTTSAFNNFTFAGGASYLVIDGDRLTLVNSASGIQLNVGSNITNGQYTLATTVTGATLIHASTASTASTTTLSTTIHNTGTVTQDSLNYSGLGGSPSSGTASTGTTPSGTNLLQGASASNGQTFTAGTTGAVVTLTPTATVTNNSGLAGTPTLQSSTGASVMVYSGQENWGGASSGAYSNNALWTDSTASGVHAAPGLDSNFTSTDTANFNSGSGGNVSIDVSPSLLGISFSTSGSYNLTAGGGTLKLNGGTGDAFVNVTTGSPTISAPVSLTTATDFNVASTDTLTISGPLSGTGSFNVNTGTGTTVLSNSTGNSGFTGPTMVTAGTLAITNTSGSATGSGLVTVGNGAAGSGTLSGNGQIIGAGVQITAGGKLVSGSPSQISSTNSAMLTTVGGMVLNTSTQLKVGTAGSGTVTANLTFDLASGTSAYGGGTAGVQTFGSPNNNTTYLSLNNSSSINFIGPTSISLVDLTNGSLALRVGTPYLLVHADSNADYFNLVINTGTATNPMYTLSQYDTSANGYVAGVYDGSVTASPTLTSAYLAANYSTIAIGQYGSGGVTPLTPGANGTYASPALYLDAGNLEVVPEPGTWALMIGGFALLVIIQRRKLRD